MGVMGVKRSVSLTCTSILLGFLAAGEALAQDTLYYRFAFGTECP
jgi:hypothetical protein